MTLNDLREAAAAEHKSQFVTGTLTIELRRQSVRVAGFGDQAVRSIDVPCMDKPVASFGMAAGGGEAEVLTRRYRVWSEDLVLDGRPVTLGRGNWVEYRMHDASGVAAGPPVRATVTNTSDDLGGRAVMLECEIDEGSASAG